MKGEHVIVEMNEGNEQGREKSSGKGDSWKEENERDEYDCKENEREGKK